MPLPRAGPTNRGERDAHTITYACSLHPQMKGTVTVQWDRHRRGYATSGMMRIATMFATLIIGLIAGPAVSL
jgi:hypothetical protein